MRIWRAELPARESLVIFLIDRRKCDYKIFKEILDWYIVSVENDFMKINVAERREVDKILRRVKSRKNDYFMKSYIYQIVKHWFDPYLDNGEA